MKVVVFGAAGWTGRAVLTNLEGKHEIRAFEYSPSAWDAWKEEDEEWHGNIVHGDIADFKTVHSATKGMDAIIHLAVRHPSGPRIEDDQQPFLVNLKGLWNVFESARQRGINRIAHVGSCQTVHPKGVFFTSEVRRPDASLYAVTKRLQEEMCRQFHEAHGMRIIVLRPDYIVDSRLGIGTGKENIQGSYRNGLVCRHDLAEACRLAIESETIDFDIFHIVGTPEADDTCNVARSRDVLGLTYKGNLEQYR